ncbi:MAG TPA: GTP-binding protein [Methylomusa anaerophila]|uniref:Hydrogenase/urease nickel incorporation protein HypB n=1 Tax=Methylomusa anaerophila TaxID=1930071 RepID=A0A348ALE8_9FIRM|nr:GTP-binding protein [Methylomusa anaerophila]BBB91896.1 hydrogenase/urease nickel incorporation protein HypB [Methylomusa anaerophila]HML88373.1 GTP-binding protein [Methylomusa anaerophila]
MQLVTVAGPPSSGKTSAILKIIDSLRADGLKVGVVKFDCLSTKDQELYQKRGVVAKLGLSGNLCPDHFFVSNIEDCLEWAKRSKFDMLISESAGLCNRCSPHIRGALAVCLIDNLSGVHTPQKIGPMLKLADVVIITKGDIVSQAEREVFAFRVRQANPGATIVHINGITGQGALEASRLFKAAAHFDSLAGCHLRFSMPAATCSYCLGQTRIGENFQMGNVKRMDLG